MFNLTATASQISFEEGITTLIPLGLTILGIAVYGVFIFKFYRFLARKDIFNLNLAKYNQAVHPVLEKFFALILYFVEYIIIFPLFIIFWFLVLSTLVGLLSKRGFQDVFLISMAIVSATRIAAFYNEELSKDLAKMIPFALLAVLIIDITFITFESIKVVLNNILISWKTIFYYLVLAMGLELFLRMIDPVISLFFAPKE
ncbi:hypothetical protein GOV09_07295 [Candidatus Woesearchaeota archaeon]|nr:hypothetical protein [Candidatus Woesearchaeota archaeon]